MTSQEHSTNSVNDLLFTSQPDMVRNVMVDVGSSTSDYHMVTFSVRGSTGKLMESVCKFG